MFVERLQFYRFPVNSANTAGTVQEGLVLQTDDDAPFRLCGIAIWTNDVIGGAFDGQLSIRFQRPDGRLVQRLITPTSVIASGNAYAGAASPTGANPNQALITPVSPNIIYPPRSVITIDAQTLSGAPVTPGTIIVFVGVKIFKEEDVWAPKYPAKFTARPYLNSLSVPNVSIANGPLLNQPFTVEQDADFVFQLGGYSDFCAARECHFRGASSIGISYGCRNHCNNWHQRHDHQSGRCKCRRAESAHVDHRHWEHHHGGRQHGCGRVAQWHGATGGGFD